MTPEQKTKLEAAGWKVITDGFWASPLTGRQFTDAEALCLLALKPRTRRSYQPTIYRRR